MTVYANGLEIACKAQANQVIAAFPDVCFTPPENPATPPGVPVPYPSFGVDSDNDKGTGSVKIGGETVSQKNLSYYTKTTGTEAGSAAKKGIVTSKNTGKSYNEAWSNNVKMDGEPVSRFGDLSTNNHASPTGNTPPWVKAAAANAPDRCKKIIAKIHPYNQRKKKCKKPAQSHHIIDNSGFTMTGARGTALKNIEAASGIDHEFGRQARNLFQPDGGGHPGEDYDENHAPCICLKGSKSDPSSQHGTAHETTESIADTKKTTDGKWKYSEAKAAGKKSIKDALNLSDLEADCIDIALEAYYEDHLGCKDNTEIVAPPGQADATSFDRGDGVKVDAYELVD